MTKVYFPRIILPAASVLASLLDFTIGVALLELVLVVRGEAPGLASLAMVPLFMLLLQLIGLGAGFISAALSVKFRDVQYVVPFLIQLLLYASPVAYGITAVPRPVRGLYLLVSTDSRDAWFDVEAGGTRTITLVLHDVELRAGAYTLGLTLRTMAEVLDEVDAVVRFEVESRPETPYERWPGWPQAAYLPRYEVMVR